MLNCMRVILDHPRSAIVESIRFIVLEILPFIILAFCLEIAYSLHYFRCTCAESRQSTFGVETIHIFGFVGSPNQHRTSHA